MKGMSMDDGSNKSLPAEVKISWVPLVVLVMCLVLVQCLAYFGIVELYGKPGGSGPFGDMFGAVNTLFSGMAFAGVIYAILLQRKELALQRAELRLTRGELKQSRIEAERTASAQEQQVTLAALAQLVPLYRGEVESTRYDLQELGDKIDRAKHDGSHEGKLEYDLKMYEHTQKMLTSQENLLQICRDHLDDLYQDIYDKRKLEGSA